MRTILLLLSILATHAFAQETTLPAIEGVWIEVHGLHPSTLQIKPDGTGVWSIGGDSYQFDHTVKVEKHDDMYIVRAYVEEGLAAKIVLSGWSTSSGERLFGTQFKYLPEDWDEAPYNGLQMYFVREHDKDEALLTSFHDRPTTRKVDESRIADLVRILEATHSISPETEGNTRIYRGRVGQYWVTGPEHPAHPAALTIGYDTVGFDETRTDFGFVLLIGRYAGNKAAYEIWKDEIAKNFREEFLRCRPLVDLCTRCRPDSSKGAEEGTSRPDPQP